MDVSSGEVIFRVNLSRLSPAQVQRLISNMDLMYDFSPADVRERMHLLRLRLDERADKGQPTERLSYEYALLEELSTYLDDTSVSPATPV